MSGALLPKQVGLRLAAHDVHERNAIREADPIEHLTDVGRCRRVDERLVAFASHRFHHAEHRQRIDEG